MSGEIIREPANNWLRTGGLVFQIKSFHPLEIEDKLPFEVIRVEWNEDRRMNNVLLGRIGKPDKRFWVAESDIVPVEATCQIG